MEHNKSTATQLVQRWAAVPIAATGEECAAKATDGARDARTVLVGRWHALAA